MKPCDRCGQPASVHLCHPRAGQEPVEIHLCELCAAKQNVIVGKELQISAIVQVMISKQGPDVADQLSRLTCPVCGMKYGEFRTQGRLGCPHDYEAFKPGLLPLLERLHRKTGHVGKRPKRRPRATLSEITELRKELRRAVDREDYERAAQLRDLIKHKEHAG
jgi:protein arginine kinase activator